MSKYEIQVEKTIDTGHRIVGHKGKCANMHGHTYKFSILAASNTLVPPGFIVDFGDIKDILNEWDHRFLLWDQDPLIAASEMPPVNLEQYGFIVVPFNPTAENMVEYLAKRFVVQFGLEHCVVTTWETPSACATFGWSQQEAEMERTLL